MIGIIGGSGFYNFMKHMRRETIETPFGFVDVEIGKINDKEIMFLPRHGKNHSIPPHKINFRANIFAAHLKKVEYLITTNAVGALHTEYEIGDFVLINDIIDFSKGREITFFDGSNFQVTTNSGSELSGVIHTNVTNCYSRKLRDRILQICDEIDVNIHSRGVIVVSNGPRFETPAEISGFQKMGGDLIGMTSSPEVFLAKELEIPYASIAIVTNYAAGLQSSVNAEEVFEIFSQKIESIKDLFKNLLTKL